MAERAKLQKFDDFRNERILQNYALLRKEKESLEAKVKD